MESSTVLVGMEMRTLCTLAKSVHYISCGKLKRAAELIDEAARGAKDDKLEELVAQCRKLGLIAQTRKHIRKADELLANGDFDASLNRLQTTSCTGVPRELIFHLLHNKAVCLARLQQWEEAVHCFQEALMRFPGDPLAYQNIAYALMEAGDYETALTYFSDIIRADNIDPASLLYVLYSAAMCRHHLDPDGEHAVGAASAKLALERLPAPSANALPFGPGMEPDAHVDASHWSFQRPPGLQIHTSAEESDEEVPPAIKTHVPFRQIRYKPPNPTSHITGKKPMELSVETKTSPVRLLREVIGSPAGKAGKGKAEELWEAVRDFGHVVSVHESALTTDDSVVSAASSKQQRRVKPTDPSPPVKQQAAVPVQKPQAASGADAVQPLSPALGQVHLSSSKPRLQGPGRRVTGGTVSVGSHLDMKRSVADDELKVRSVAPAVPPVLETANPLPTERVPAPGQPTTPPLRPAAPSKPHRASFLSDAFQPEAVPHPTSSDPAGVQPNPRPTMAQAPVTTTAFADNSKRVAPTSHVSLEQHVEQHVSTMLAEPAPRPHTPDYFCIPSQPSSAESSLTGATDPGGAVHSKRVPSLQHHKAYIPAQTEPSWQQREVELALESRRHVDRYTITKEDIALLRTGTGTQGPPAQETAHFYPYPMLRSPGPFPADVDVRHREYYLTDVEFERLLRVDKKAWADLPPWRQRSVKQALGLF